MRRAPRWRFAAVVIVGLANALPAEAYQPIVHEFIPPDDREDLKLAVTTVEGDLPAAIETSSGVVRAPDTDRAPASSDSSYGQPSSPGAVAAPESVFKADRDTRRPSVVKYDDPFTPAITPYKRLRAYDAVAADSTLHVRETALVRVALGGEARADEDQFYGDVTVDFDASGSVLIPSVGPGARILAQHTVPAVPLEVWRDGADNWYARPRGSAKGKVRLVVQLAIARRAFGGPLNMPSRNVLPAVPPLTLQLAREVERVAGVIGITRATPPAEAVQKMVAYFRAFSDSDAPPHGEADIYLDLALSQKGVCRHRAFAFLITALGLGIPTRMVVNEAHAWVEVRSVDMWQRIDLGGAPSAIDERVALGRADYLPPADPFPWPAASDGSSGKEAVRRGEQARRARASQPRNASSNADTSSANSQGSAQGDPSAEVSDDATASPSPSAWAAGAGRAAREDVNGLVARDLPRATITVDSDDMRVRRGGLVALRGRVNAEDGAPCPSARVDVQLVARGAKPVLLGALAADTSGAFAGELIVPLSFALGEYEVRFSSPMSERCAAAR